MTLTEKIIEFCAEQYPLWVHSGAIERFSMDYGFKAANGGRRGTVCKYQITNQAHDIGTSAE